MEPLRWELGTLLTDDERRLAARGNENPPARSVSRCRSLANSERDVEALLYPEAWKSIAGLEWWKGSQESAYS